MRPIRDVVAAMMLSLRRRYLERFIDAPFDAKVSRELDAEIEAQEELTPPKAEGEAMAQIIVNGKSYRVIERLPYHPQGMEVRIVADSSSPTGERVAVKRGAGCWVWWTCTE